ncbi:MAG: hypothetical protein KDI75_03800 [Xanthomonadales bacterium]|nr:hypothetical protein [Xanthomonadales bacterium]
MSRLQPLLARFALIVAGMLLALALARLLWLLVAGPQIPVDDRPLEMPVAIGTASAPSAPIAGWHLFGRAGRRIEPRAPETTLQLFLRGTLNDSSGDGGIAIIADANGSERGYRLGDELPGGATLKAIHAGRVELERDGRRESLSLPNNVAGSGGSDAVAPLANPASAASGSTTPAGLPGSPGAPFINPAISVGVPDLATARARALPDLRAMASEVNVLPVLENGQMVGVRVSGKRGSDLLSRYGIQPNDVIIAVNDVPLDGPQRQAELTRSLSSANQVKLTVRRDGRELQLTLGMR